MSRPETAFAVVLAAAISAVAHLLAVPYFLIGVCGVSDTADRVPADASPQGLICDAGQRDDWWGVVGYAALVASAVLAVAVAWLVWRYGGRWLALLVPVAMAVLTLVLLSAPSDTCSDEARRTEPAYACETTPG